MLICSYLQRIKSNDRISKKLSLCVPDTVGPLPKEVPSSLISKGDEVAQANLEKQKEPNKCAWSVPNAITGC